MTKRKGRLLGHTATCTVFFAACSARTPIYGEGTLSDQNTADGDGVAAAVTLD